MGYGVDYYDPNGALLVDEELDDCSYIGRHWRGNLPLSQSYWLNGFLSNLILMGMGIAFFALEKTGRSLRIIAVGFLLYIVLFLLTRVWAMVGVWRSAGRHAARGGSAGWGTVARVVVVLSLFGTLAQLPAFGLQAKEYGLIAIGQDPLGSVASLSLDGSGETLELKGILAAGVADRFEEKIQAAPNIKTVVLDSDGGRIFEALRMAKLIRAQGFDTRVERNCASACTFLLLAGKDRSAHRFAQIGFHQPDFPGISEAERSQVIADNRQDYVDAGIQPAFLDRAMSTPPQEMWYPAHAELVEAGVLTAEEFTVGSSRSDRQRLQELLARMEVDTNKSRGVMIDEMTRLEGAKLSGSELRVHHRLTKAFAQPQIEQMKSTLRVGISQELCNSPRRGLIDMGASFGFDYDDSDGRQIISLTIDKCSGGTAS